MEDLNVDDILGAPIRGLEIDTKVPAYKLEDYGIDGVILESRALDVSFGHRKVKVLVVKAKKWLG